MNEDTFCSIETILQSTPVAFENKNFVRLKKRRYAHNVSRFNPGRMGFIWQELVGACLLFQPKDLQPTAEVTVRESLKFVEILQ